MNDLRMHKNENWDDVQFEWGVFRGMYVALPLFCTLLFIPISMFCNALGMDVFSLAIFGGTPFLISSAVVIFFINDKPPSYGTDILKWWKFKIHERWYMKGWIDRPPILE